MNSEEDSAKSFPFGQKAVWKPDPAELKATNLYRFMQTHHIDNYQTLFKKSVSDISWFWDAVLKDLDIRFTRPYSKVVDLSEGLRFPRWCVGGEMNIVANCLDKWQNTPVYDQDALRWEGEEGTVRTLSYRQLSEETSRCANALLKLGLRKGDAVGLFMPMIPEIVVAFLAIIKAGGIVLPLFSGYGSSAISTRLEDAGARMLITADGMVRRGKKIPMKPVADQALQQVSTVEKVLVFQRTGSEDIPLNSERDVLWKDIVPGQSTRCQTENTLAEDVMMVIYTSGTTGKPKGAVHTHCGFPIKAAQDMYHCMDLKRGETMYWMSDMGWMMGPWEVFGTLLIGATMVLYDGAPDYPSPDRIWGILERHRVTHWGLTPSLIRALMPHGTESVRKHDLSNLRMAGSTGSPWDPESWLWTFTNVLEGKKPIINYSGGTEISGGILSGNFFVPLKPAAFSGPVPGMDADVVDPDGQPLRNAVGELVIRQPWIGMTRGFWKNNQRYLDTYWSRFDNIWLHGDFAAIDGDGLWYILGRSDDTINVAGKRLGPAEVESIINSHDAVVESAAIGVPDDIKGEAVVVYCVLQNASIDKETIRRELMARVARQLGKPLKPRELLFCGSLPKTRNAKVMRRLIRAVYMNKPLGDVSSLENPAVLEDIKSAV